MKMEGIIIATMLAFGLMVGMGTFLSNGADNYGIQTNSSFVDYGEQQSKSMNETASSLKEVTEELTSGNLLGVFSAAIKFVTDAIPQFLSFLGYPLTLVADITGTDYLGGHIPGWVSMMVFSIILVVGTIGILNWGRGTDRI